MQGHCTTSVSRVARSYGTCLKLTPRSTRGAVGGFLPHKKHTHASSETSPRPEEMGGPGFNVGLRAYRIQSELTPRKKTTLSAGPPLAPRSPFLADARLQMDSAAGNVTPDMRTVLAAALRGVKKASKPRRRSRNLGAQPKAPRGVHNPPGAHDAATASRPASRSVTHAPRPPESSPRSQHLHTGPDRPLAGPSLHRRPAAPPLGPGRPAGLLRGRRIADRPRAQRVLSKTLANHA